MRLGLVLLIMVMVGCSGRDRGEGEGSGDDAGPPVWEPVPEGLADDALAEWLIDRARYAEALPVVERVVEQRRPDGVGALKLGEGLMSLGMVRDALGEPEEALAPLAEAWQLFQEGAAPLALRGACADALGLACQGAENYEDAERAFLAAIELRRSASPGEDEPWVSASRVHLGRLYLTMARYEESGDLLRAALESARDDESRAKRNRHLGAFYHTLGGYVRAVDYFEKSLAAARKTWGEGSAEVAATLGDLGLSQLRAGDVAMAEENLKRSRNGILALPDAPPDLLAVSAKNLAAYHLFAGDLDEAAELLAGSDDAVPLNNLGSAYHLQGELDAAAEAFGKAWQLAREKLTERHPLRVQILQNQACLLMDRGESAAALQGARDAGKAALALLDHLLAFGSEGQKLDFRRTSDPLSLLCSSGAEPEEIAQMILRTKGVVLDSVLQAGNEPTEVRRMELPAAATFIDYAVFQHYRGNGEWEQRYGAVVLEGGGEGAVRWVELGKADRLRGFLADLRAHMDAEATGGKSDAVFSIDAVLVALYDFCIAPLGELQGELIFSPDGELGVVPFAALRHDGKFFAELFSDVKFVPSARAVDDVAAVGAGEGWALCAVEKYSGRELPWPGEGARIGRGLWEKISSLGNLPGVAREREVLGGIADFRALPTDEFELRRALSGDAPPLRVLHFSCHGFFLEGGRRPMFQSGLVLGGARRSLVRIAAQQPVDPEADNVLFAGEIAGMRLGGTELVTLAACDTGLGVTVAGEGVLGLQRGFQLAGARNILMTLWAMGDQSLPEFLGACYKRIAAGEPAASAVWRVQGERLVELARGAPLTRAVWEAGGFAVLARHP